VPSCRPQIINYKSMTMSEIFWSHNCVVELIELYQAHSCLYDTKDELYYNKNARRAALEEIKEPLSKVSFSIRFLLN